MAAPNVFQTIINAESGGRNVNNYMFDSTHTASGYFQITDSTWKSTAAGQASGFTHAMDAPFSTQQDVAAELISKNGLKDWAPYDHIDANLNDYDTSKLSGPGGTSTGGAGVAQPAASGNGAWSSGAASGDDSDGVLNPSTVPLAITTSQKADDTTSKANTKSLTDTSKANTASAVGVVKGAYAAAHLALGDTLFRVGLVIIGAVLLAGGLWIIASEEGTVPGPRKVLKTAAKLAVAA